MARGRMGFPTVYAQPMERNDRICSLLSSVLFRRIERPNFHAAVKRSFPSSIERAENYVQIPVIILLLDQLVDGRSNNDVVGTLKESLQASSMILVEISEHAAMAHRLRKIRSAIHESTPVFLLALNSACSWIQQSFTNDDGFMNLTRLILLHPPEGCGIVPSSPTVLTVANRCSCFEKQGISSAQLFPNHIFVSVPCVGHVHVEIALKFIHAVCATSSPIIVNECRHSSPPDMWIRSRL
jgi:hypothetical protein